MIDKAIVCIFSSDSASLYGLRDETNRINIMI